MNVSPTAVFQDDRFFLLSKKARVLDLRGVSHFERIRLDSSLGLDKSTASLVKNPIPVTLIVFPHPHQNLTVFLLSRLRRLRASYFYFLECRMGYQSAPVLAFVPEGKQVEGPRALRTICPLPS